MTNRIELRIVGMSRSGNHAIINWITRQISGRYCFLNCAEPKTNPFLTARPIVDDVTYDANYDEFDLAAEQRGDFTQKDYLIHSYEDCFLGMVAGDHFEEYHDAYVGPSSRRIDMLILRDPFNLFASRRRSSYAEVTERTAARIWKQHAREMIGSASYLNQERLLVSYNSWATDKAYRAKLARQLDLGFTDAGAEEVSPAGDGSSFDGCRYDGQASQMQVMDRWRHYADDVSFRRLFDDQVVEFSREVFDPVPGMAALVEEEAAIQTS